MVLRESLNMTYEAGDLLLDTVKETYYIVIQTPTDNDWYYTVYDFDRECIHPIAIGSITDIRTERVA